MSLTSSGVRTPLLPEQVAAFAAQLRGPVIQPGDPSYDEARAVYNAMIDKHPALIAQCANVADVMATVNLAREHGLPLAVRGGGHNGAGLGTVEGGIVLDLGLMHGIRVDPTARTARVEGGATLGDVHHATFPFGLVTPSGIISTTGVGGITLGGGLGYLTRKFGLAIDNLLEADVVLADGTLVTSSPDHSRAARCACVCTPPGARSHHPHRLPPRPHLLQLRPPRHRRSHTPRPPPPVRTGSRDPGPTPGHDHPREPLPGTPAGPLPRPRHQSP